MKDAWDRLRQCISPTTAMSHYGNQTLPILNQVFHFVCGSLIPLSSSSPTQLGGQTYSQGDPKAITLAILQQQQRAEVTKLSVYTVLLSTSRNLQRNYTALVPDICQLSEFIMYHLNVTGDGIILMGSKYSWKRFKTSNNMCRMEIIWNSLFHKVYFKSLTVNCIIMYLIFIIRFVLKPSVRCRLFYPRWRKRAVGSQTPVSFHHYCSLCSFSSSRDALLWEHKS